MENEFAHPAALDLLARIKASFQSDNIFQKKESPILFVCGGPVSDGDRTLRKRFIEWANKALPEIVIILAERAFRETHFHTPPEIVNLAKFEALIADISDGVVIFPESVGSFAEVGYFSGIRGIRQKTLIVNDLNYQAKDSFANLGPIKTIDSDSFLQYALYLDPEDPNFDHVGERLNRMLERKHRKRFRYGSYKTLNYLEKLLVVLELINILRIASVDGLLFAVRRVFDSANSTDLKHLVSILLATGHVRREHEFLTMADDAQSLLEFENTRIEHLMVSATLYHMKYQPTMFSLLRANNHAA